LLGPLLLRYTWFSGLVFWWSWWSLAFLSQLLSCLTNISSFFSFNFYFILEFWDSIFHLSLFARVAFNCVLCFCLVLFLRFSISWVTSSLIFFYFHL
jgi:hypothetical protein